MHTYLDIQEIERGTLDEIPEPVPTEIPKEWLGWSKEFGDSGTLVVWSQIDRCIWRTGRAIIENSEQLIGRMYRKFLEDDNVKIRLACIESESLTYPLQFGPDDRAQWPADQQVQWETCYLGFWRRWREWCG